MSRRSRNRWCERHKASEAAVLEAGGEETEETFDEANKRWDQLIGLESTVEEGNLIYRTPNGIPLALATLCEFKGRLTACFGHPYGIQQNWLRENGEAR